MANAGPSPDEVIVLRPWRLRFVAIGFAVILTGATVFGWFAFPPEFRAEFTVSQVLTLLLVLAFLVGVMVALAASRVRADDVGLDIRNGLKTYRVPWEQVHQILLRTNDPWATVLLKPPDRPFTVDLDAEKRALMGIQNHDGARAQRAAAELRRRHAQWRALTRSRGT